LGDKAQRIVATVAAELSLAEPLAVWHTAREDWVALGCGLGLLAGSLGKMARDLSLMGQFEVGEVSEPGGGSSAMPHKRNPLGSMIALAAAVRAPHRVAALLAAMPQEHERALGGWQAEGAEWTELLQLVAGSARAMAAVAAALAADERRVNAQRMRDNIGAVRSALSEDAAAQWFDPDTAATLAPEVEKLCVRIEQLPGVFP
jgi:3-carboxy-cis,cis-muconate cycloisomerase